MQPRVPFPLVLDPSRQVTEALAFRRQGRAAYFLNVRAWLRWLRALLTHRRQGRFTGHHSSLPGVAILDSLGEPTWIYRGRELGDYPRLADVLQRLAQVE